MKRKWYEIKAAAGGGAPAEIFIYDYVGEDLWGGGIGAKAFIDELNAVTATQIDLHINSPGGSVFDGFAIFNAVRRHSAKVTSYVDGLAASIASVIALAGDRVLMAENALFMIHMPFGCACGTAAELRKTAEALDHIAESMLNTYEAKATLLRAEIEAACAEETWYSAAEALEAGFIDEIEEAQSLAACSAFDLSRFKHVPPEVAVAIADPAPAAEAETESGDTPTTVDPRVIELLTIRRHSAPKED